MVQLSSSCVCRAWQRVSVNMQRHVLLTEVKQKEQSLFSSCGRLAVPVVSCTVGRNLKCLSAMRDNAAQEIQSGGMTNVLFTACVERTAPMTTHTFLIYQCICYALLLYEREKTTHTCILHTLLQSNTVTLHVVSVISVSQRPTK